MLYINNEVKYYETYACDMYGDVTRKELVGLANQYFSSLVTDSSDSY